MSEKIEPAEMWAAVDPNMPDQPLFVSRYDYLVAAEIDRVLGVAWHRMKERGWRIIPVLVTPKEPADEQR